jgi:hypothetical protein
MFQDSLLRPQWMMFKSPDVALFPFVGGSMHTVITPLWTPGLRLPLADASEATVPNASTTPTIAGQFTLGDFAIGTPLLGFVERAPAAPRTMLRRSHCDLKPPIRSFATPITLGPDGRLHQSLGAMRRPRRGGALQDSQRMGRAGIEPATLGLKVPCSTS